LLKVLNTMPRFKGGFCENVWRLYFPSYYLFLVGFRKVIFQSLESLHVFFAKFISQSLKSQVHRYLVLKLVGVLCVICSKIYIIGRRH